MSSREKEEGTKERQDDYEADHKGKEPVRQGSLKIPKIEFFIKLIFEV